ncbi:hypothetical protein M405DRAFT_879517 [Rhizopogon salebrosus TDB-379]|nr:hypothetical protein M405DRAFT_879517 [Rhizopogon salebrosus TDB-379]
MTSRVLRVPLVIRMGLPTSKQSPGRSMQVEREDRPKRRFPILFNISACILFALITDWYYSAAILLVIFSGQCGEVRDEQILHVHEAALHVIVSDRGNSMTMTPAVKANMLLDNTLTSWSRNSIMMTQIWSLGPRHGCAGDSGQTKNCFISPDDDDDDDDDDSAWLVRIGHGRFNGVSQLRSRSGNFWPAPTAQEAFKTPNVSTAASPSHWLFHGHSSSSRGRRDV